MIQAVSSASSAASSAAASAGTGSASSAVAAASKGNTTGASSEHALSASAQLAIRSVSQLPAEALNSLVMPKSKDAAQESSKLPETSTLLRSGEKAGLPLSLPSADDTAPVAEKPSGARLLALEKTSKKLRGEDETPSRQVVRIEASVQLTPESFHQGQEHSLRKTDT